MVSVSYKLDLAIERGTKPWVLVGKPYHWTGTIQGYEGERQTG